MNIVNAIGFGIIGFWVSFFLLVYFLGRAEKTEDERDAIFVGAFFLSALAGLGVFLIAL